LTSSIDYPKIELSPCSRLLNLRHHIVITPKRAFLLVTVSAALLVAGGGFIQIISTNRVSDDWPRYRWEASSSAGASWVTSWNDITLQNDAFPAFTASWNGAWNRYPHVFNGRSPVDLYLAFNAAQNRHNLVMIDPGTYNVGYRSSTDAWGGNWNPIVIAAAAGDYPSVAIATNGTIIVGFNQVGISVPASR
jgi:hypothetical protein